MQFDDNDNIIKLLQYGIYYYISGRVFELFTNTHNIIKILMSSDNLKQTNCSIHKMFNLEVYNHIEKAGKWERLLCIRCHMTCVKRKHCNGCIKFELNDIKY